MAVLSSLGRVLLFLDMALVLRPKEPLKVRCARSSGDK